MRIAPAECLAARRLRLNETLGAAGLDVLVVTHLPNIAYLTGFFASAAALIVSPGQLHLVADGRYGETLAARVDAYPAIRPHQLAPGASFDEAIVQTLASLTGLRVGVESLHLTLQRHRFLTRSLTALGWSQPLVETAGLVEGLRAVKDAWEIARLREGAGRLSELAKRMIGKRLEGRVESDIAADIDAGLRRAGFERPAFDTIVAAGPNGARPHGRAGGRLIERGDLVVLDFGGVFDGYCTDLTRTVPAGRAGPREREWMTAVVAAQAAALEAIRPGAAPEAVDGAARARLVAAGLGAAFTHGTGHGLGLEIHEAPRVTRERLGHPEPPLAAGMVLTVEPGVYLPGLGGVRVEDDVLVTETGAECLTDVPRTES